MRLIAISGPDQGRTYELPALSAVTLGRGADLPNPLTDPRASRKHCIIEVVDGAVTIKDCDSRGGTFVNGRTIKSAVLLPGDVIRIGETELRYQDAGADDATLGTRSPKNRKQRMTCQGWWARRSIITAWNESSPREKRGGSFMHGTQNMIAISP